MFSRHKFNMIIKTPLHIAADEREKIQPFEYWKEGNKLCIADFDKFINIIDKKKIDELIKLMSGIKSSNQEDDQLTFLDILKKFNMEDQKEKFIKRKVEFLGDGNPSIEMFISHPKGNPYIPGSSIKGAIVTALLYDKIKSDQEIERHFNNLISRDISEEKKAKQKIDSAIEEIGKEIMVEDIEFSSNFLMVGRFLRKYKNNNRSQGRATFSFVEFIKPGTCLEVNIYIRNGGKIGIENVNDLIKKVNGFYYELVLEKIKKAFNNQIDFNNANIEDPENEMLIQIGKFGGFYTKAIPNKDLRYLIKREPKTIPLINDNLAGWVSLKVEEDGRH
jgi:CRISPR type III-A-associated RAMP protein Csm5